MTDAIPAVLACDVGNSTIRLATVTGEEVSETITVRVGEAGSLAEPIKAMWADKAAPQRFVASSVNASALKAVRAAAAQAVGQDVLLVGRDLPLPIDTDLDKPNAIGVDRLCCAAAAFDQLGVACVVADFGTAITVDCVSDAGVFLGGAIMPGLAMSADALSRGTAQLPHVDLASPDWTFGKDTTEAIVGGLVNGARGALRQLVEAYATALQHWPAVIATGGDAELICNETATRSLVTAIVPNLALRGTAIAYYRSLLKQPPDGTHP